MDIVLETFDCLRSRQLENIKIREDQRKRKYTQEKSNIIDINDKRNIEKYGLRKTLKIFYNSKYYKKHKRFKLKQIRALNGILKKYKKKINYNVKLINPTLFKKQSKIKQNIEKRIIVKTSADYSEYLKSQHWIKRRADYWKNHPRICYCCRNYAENLHHRIYELYKEKDRHFVPLCFKCHKEIHKLINSKGIKLSIAHKVYKDTLTKF